MKQIQMNTTKKITLCGVFAALALALLYIGGLTVMDLSVVGVCALMTMLLVIETDVKYAWIYAAVTSVLALLLLPNKIYAVEYICFGALYPVAKLYFEKLLPMFAWLVKISFLDMLLLLCLVLGQFVFHLGDEYFAFNILTVLIGTAFFVLFDLALTACVTFYIVKLRKRLGLGK